jgi:nucleoside-diphosphate-sugar epimerase
MPAAEFTLSAAHILPRPAFVPEFVDYSAFAGQTVGITGQRGVLGGLLYERLRRFGVQVVAFPGDVNDEKLLTTWFSGYQFSHFFHFAAVVPVPLVEGNPVAAYRTNAIGSFNVCSHLALTQKKYWLFLASSSHVYKPTAPEAHITELSETEPQTFYGVTKLAGERLCVPLLQKMNVEYCVGRIFSFSHEKQQEPYLVPTLRKKISQLNNGDTLSVSNPSAVRDIQDADAIIDCVLHLAHKRSRGIINIGTGHGMSVKEIALLVARSQQKVITVDGVDIDAHGALVADTHKLRSILS